MAERTLSRMRAQARDEGALKTLTRIPRKVADNIWKAELRRRDPFAWRAMKARYQGAKVGKNVRMFESVEFMSEPYLVEIGDNVVIAGQTRFLTHDGGPLAFRHEVPEMEVYGKITIGNNVFVGMGSVFFPGTSVGDDCIIGAYSVVRSRIPPGSVAMGNPAKVIFPIAMARKLMLNNKNCLSRIYPTLEDQAEVLFRHFGLDPDSYDDLFQMKKELQRRLGSNGSPHGHGK